MCRKLLLLIAVLGLVGTVWADDPCAPDWRGDPGSATAWYGFDTAVTGGPMRAPEASQWFYKPGEPDNPIGNFRERAIDENMASHWEEGLAWSGATWEETSTWIVGDFDMPLSYYEDNFTMQEEDESYPQTWYSTYLERTGVLQWPGGSWDIYNFDSPQPDKYFQFQITWQPSTRGEEVTMGFGMEYYAMEELHWAEEVWWEKAGWNSGEEEYEGWLSGWPLEDPPPEIWWEEGGWFAWGVYDEVFWRDEASWMDEGWWTGGEDPVEYNLGWWDDEMLVPIYEIAHEGDWRTSVFLINIKPNPYFEFLELWPQVWDEELEEYINATIAVDQVVIDTICIPEPFTISLLGLGGLALIRRRKR